MGDATVLVLIDACRWDYVNPTDMPFVWSCADRGMHYKRVVPGRGFCERSEILTGRSARDTGYFAAIGYDPDRSPFSDRQPLLRMGALGERLAPTDLTRRLWRRALARLMWYGGVRMRPYEIPLPWLPHFALTEDLHEHDTPEAFGGNSLLDELAAQGRSTFLRSFTSLSTRPNGTDRSRLASALARAGEDHALFLVYLGALDQVGHESGPDSRERRLETRQVDRQLSDFVAAFERKRRGTRFVLLGDHGMVPVEQSVDLGNVLRNCCERQGLVPGRDVVWFLDSTMCRVWCHDEKARAVVREALENDEIFRGAGTFVSKETALREEVPFGDERYGHVMWWADKGVVVNPDFFRLDRPVKGMHGYDCRLPESQGTCVAFGPTVERGVRDSIPLRDVHGILSHLLKP